MKLLGKASDRFRLDAASGRVYLNSYPAVAGSFLAADNRADDKFYLRIRATDRAGHITESQLVVHVKDGGEDRDEDEVEEDIEEEVTTNRPAPVFEKKRTTSTTTTTTSTTSTTTTTRDDTYITYTSFFGPPPPEHILCSRAECHKGNGGKLSNSLFDGLT